MPSASRDPRRMNGAQISQGLVDTGHLFGYIAFHPRPARTQKGWTTAVEFDGKGYPDLTLAGPAGVMFIEVKGDGDKLRPDQERWLHALRQGGAVAWVCSGRTWRSGLAIEIIAGRADVPPGPLDPADAHQ